MAVLLGRRQCNFLVLVVLGATAFFGFLLLFHTLYDRRLVLPYNKHTQIVTVPDAAASSSAQQQRQQQHRKPKQPLWLIATMTPAQAVERRALIRSTWQSLYRNDSLFEAVFVTARPPRGWERIVEQENERHGDLVVLDHIEESHSVATHTKPFEFYAWLVAQDSKYAFVSKADDDAFVDPVRFADRFLHPLVAAVGGGPELPPVVVGRKLPLRKTYPAPSGQLITMSWAAVETLVRLHAENPVQDHEDALVGRLLYEGDIPYEFVEVANEFAFDYKEEEDEADRVLVNGKETAWAAEDADMTARSHAVGPEAMVPHKLKTDEVYRQVAACFGPDGILDRPK